MPEIDPPVLIVICIIIVLIVLSIAGRRVVSRIVVRLAENRIKHYHPAAILGQAGQQLGVQTSIPMTALLVQLTERLFVHQNHDELVCDFSWR